MDIEAAVLIAILAATDARKGVIMIFARYAQPDDFIPVVVVVVVVVVAEIGFSGRRNYNITNGGHRYCIRRRRRRSSRNRS